MAYMRRRSPTSSRPCISRPETRTARQRGPTSPSACASANATASRLEPLGAETAVPPMSQANAWGIAATGALWLALKELPGQVLAILEAKSERQRTQRDALAAFGMRCASAALLYVSQIVLARWMGSYEYGIY